ncbi:TetR-like C-terminal domain-containing protein [Streptomyces sp. NPDC086549]|uniref:TetR-like C-terminal domain-containing protein n=1 Tax=Streptomyces sp. NPDC086549 TaxID=3365752 RepID=UPI003813B798
MRNGVALGRIGYRPRYRRDACGGGAGADRDGGRGRGHPGRTPVGSSRAPPRDPGCGLSVADGEAALDEARQLRLVAKVRPAFPGLPPAAVSLALRIWGHLHGLVSLEVYGHLRTQTTGLDKLFREGLAQLTQSLNIPHRH